MFQNARRKVVSAASLLILAAAMGVPAEAGATLRVISYNDPAGDPAVVTYRLSSQTESPLVPDFVLHDREYKSFGVQPGTYTVQAMPPAGWQVGDIQCVGPSPSDFAIDVADGRVTMNHGLNVEQTCAFTNRHVQASATPGPPSPGVAPTVPDAERSKVAIPRGPALLSVRPGRGFATVTVRVSQRSVIRCSLVRGTGTVGSARVAHAPGTYQVKVPLRADAWRRLRAQGLRRVRLTARVVVVGADRSTRAFRIGVLLRL